MRAHHRSALMLCSALGLAGCGGTAWRDAYTRLAQSDSAARAAGFRPLSGPHNTFGLFNRAGSERWRVHLEAHQSYFLAAACTSGCDSLDFEIAEPHGALIARDTTAGPTPRLELAAPEEGDYQVTFTWGACHSPARCRWVAQVYAKNGGR
jgi:hypothetical protein